MLIAGFISSSITNFLLNIDGLIYNLIRYFYDMFIFLANLNLFEDSDYAEIVKKVYLILGVIMLFILAYSLLKAIINPDSFSKGDNSFPNLIKNIVVSLIIISVLPTVFKVAFNIQYAVLNSNLIPGVILGDSAPTGADEEADEVKKGGNTIAYHTFRAFFHVNEDYCTAPPEEGLGMEINKIEDLGTCEQEVYGTDNFLGFTWSNDNNLNQAFDNVSKGGTFRILAQFSSSVDDGKIDYMYLISTVAGIFLLVIILGYCVDLALRVIKLVFYQIIAPVPVICRVLPGDKKKIFDSWLKQIITTFLEVFVRVFIMYLGIYLITKVVEKWPSGIPGIDELGPTRGLIVLALIIIGVVMFIKQAPKLLKDLFGMDLGGSNPLGKMLGIGAAVGGGVTTAVRNFNGTTGSRKIFSALGGLGSGAVRGGFAARNAKNLKDMKNAASSGVKNATAARIKREKYKANHGGNFAGAMVGHATDFINSGKRFMGISSGAERLGEEIKAINSVDDAISGVKDVAKETIKKDAAKGKANTYGITRTFQSKNATWGNQYSQYSSATYHKIEQSLAEAKIKGQALDSTGVMRSLGEWQDLIGEYENAFGTELATAASVGKGTYESYSDDLQDQLSAVRSKANESRAVFQANATLDTIIKSGLTGDDFSDNKDIDFSDQRIDKNLSHNIKSDRVTLQDTYNKLKKEESGENKK